MRSLLVRSPLQEGEHVLRCTPETRVDLDPQLEPPQDEVAGGAGGQAEATLPQVILVVTPAGAEAPRPARRARAPARRRQLREAAPGTNLVDAAVEVAEAEGLLAGEAARHG